jgi:predicted porin
MFNPMIGDNCMKKSMIALAVLGALAGTASAQSSVTLFGIVDAAIARVDNGTASVTGMSNSGINSSRLGFRGTEDLGGGLKAGFWLEGQLQNDSGNTAAALNFGRRSYVNLSGGFGEVRLGREYAPTFWNTTVFDVFGTNGVAQAQTPAMLGAPVRTNNGVTYMLPGNLGGFYGQLQYAFGELASSAPNNGNYFGGRFGYANGPLDVALASGKLNGAVAGATTTATNIGASYDFGMVKPALFYGVEKSDPTGAEIKALELSAGIPLGGGTLKAAYSEYKGNAVLLNGKRKLMGLGYVYDLSKRTALYGTYARSTGSSGFSGAIGTNGMPTAISAANGTATGLELGLRHSF